MKNKFSKLFLFQFIFAANIFGQCTDFVSVEGKKLKCGQSDFFAVTCNYMFEIVYMNNTNPTDFTINNFFPTKEHNSSPDNMASPQINNRTQAFNAIRKEFLELKEKGFNCLRIVANSCTYGDLGALNCNTSNKINIPITDPKHNLLILDVYENILAAASQADLKVVILLSNVTTSVPYPDNTKNPAITPPVNVTNGFIDFLKQFATRFKDNPTLMAVDFCNEPDLKIRESKSTICNLVKNWNNAIKSRSNILTTIGLWTHAGFSWDPNFLNIDFVSIHNYPIVTDTINMSDLPQAIDRIKSDYWWCKNNIRIPWMVGETGLEAHPNNTNHPVNSTGKWTKGFSAGTLQDQADYLSATLNACLDYGGVGYSWWLNTDWSVGDPSNIGYYNRENSGNVFWGLAYSNEGDIQTSWKPAISSISSFNPNILRTVLQPSNYYNYYNNPNTGKYALGNVKTTTNIPIKDAIIEVFDINKKFYSTYSDANGDFIVNTLNNITTIKITATECSQFAEVVDTYGVPNVVKFVSLMKVEKSMSGSLAYVNQNAINVDVNDQSETNATFKNYQILDSKFHVTAFNYIRLNSGTSIYPNNDFSAKIGNFYHDCSSIVDNGIAFRENYRDPSSKDEITPINKKNNEIINENNFDDKKLLNNENFIVYPSPSNGAFIVSTKSNDEKQLTIINSLGIAIYKDKFINQEYHLNLNIPTGIYLVELTTSNVKQQQKIIIEK